MFGRMTRASEAIPFDLQPTLIGDLLELRPVAPSDYDALFLAASDPAIWEQHPENDRHTPEVFRRYFDGAIKSGGAFVIIDRASGRVIGSSRYNGFDPVAREVEIGWTFLEREFWGGVYNRELKDLMLGHAFQFVDRVLFIVGENNLRSRKAVEKIGGKMLRTIERPNRNGEPEKNVVFGLERAAWQPT
jgi:RimJ/RimL family protein N-acetyltransferase